MFPHHHDSRTKTGICFLFSDRHQCQIQSSPPAYPLCSSSMTSTPHWWFPPPTHWFLASLNPLTLNHSLFQQTSSMAIFWLSSLSKHMPACNKPYNQTPTLLIKSIFSSLNTCSLARVLDFSQIFLITCLSPSHTRTYKQAMIPTSHRFQPLCLSSNGLFTPILDMFQSQFKSHCLMKPPLTSLTRLSLPSLDFSSTNAFCSL